MMIMVMLLSRINISKWPFIDQSYFKCTLMLDIWTEVTKIYAYA